METKKILIIGLGNAGCQIAKLASELYSELIDAVVINSSNADLAMALNGKASNIMSFKIGDMKNDDGEVVTVDGSGKNRSTMKEYLHASIMQILRNEDFQNIVSDKKYVFICASSAGGTGSGGAPFLTKVLKKAFVDPHFIFVSILPQLSASEMDHLNTIEAMDELFNKLDKKPDDLSGNDEEGISYMIYDNDKRSDCSPTKMLEVVNREIVEDIRIFSGIDNHASPYETIDDADMESILKTPGRIIVTRITDGITEKLMEDESLDKRFIKEIKNSAHAEIDYNGQVEKWGIITHFTENVNRLYNPTLDELAKYMGNPLERFNHNSINQTNEKRNFIYMIASGLGPINDRMQRTMERVKELNDQKERHSSVKYTFDNSSISNTMASRKAAKKARAEEDFNIDDIFNEIK